MPSPIRTKRIRIVKIILHKFLLFLGSLSSSTGNSEYTGVPHLSQNRVPSFNDAPHFLHILVNELLKSDCAFTCAPQYLQNLVPSEISLPQLVHFIMYSPFLYYSYCLLPLFKYLSKRSNTSTFCHIVLGVFIDL